MRAGDPERHQARTDSRTRLVVRFRHEAIIDKLQAGFYCLGIAGAGGAGRGEEWW